MLYAYVRIKGIQRRAAESLSSEAVERLLLNQIEEIYLAKHILRFAEVLNEIEIDLYPNKVRLLSNIVALIVFSFVSTCLTCLKSLTSFTKSVRS